MRGLPQGQAALARSDGQRCGNLLGRGTGIQDGFFQYQCRERRRGMRNSSTRHALVSNLSTRVDMNKAPAPELRQNLPATAPDASADKDAPLKEDIRLLGRLLGDVVREQEGEAVF